MMKELKEQESEQNTEVVAAYHELLHKLKESKRPAQKQQSLEIVNDNKAHIHTEHEQEEIIHTKLENNNIIPIEVMHTPYECEKSFDNFKHSLGNSLDDIKKNFLDQFEQLHVLSEKIEKKTKELEQLHQIEISLTMLSDLKKEHDHKIKQLEDEFKEHRQQLENEINQKKIEYQKEEQQYIYQRDLSREKDQHRYETDKRDLYQELSNTRQQLEREIEEKETHIGNMESLQQKINEFPEHISNAVHEAKEALSQKLTLEHHHEKQLLEKELELKLQTIATLESKIAILESNIKHFEALKTSFSRLMFNPSES